MTRLAFVFVLPALAVGLAVAPAAPPVVPADRIARLIVQLGDSDFRTRDAAAKELESAGRPALAALRAAATSVDDREVARRAADIAVRIAKRAANDDALTPTLVELDVRAGKFADVVAVLEKQSGYKFQVIGDGAPAGPITVTTPGKVTVWDAVDRVCAAGGLEVVPSAPPAGQLVNNRGTFVANPGLAPAMPVPVPVGATETDAAILRAQVQSLTVRAESRDRLAAAVEVQKQKAADNETKAKFDAMIVKYKADAAAIRVQVDELKKRLATMPPPPVQLPPGTIGLRAKSPVPNPSSVHGAVRVEAVPYPKLALAGIPADTLPVLLQVHPEPKLKWERVTDVRVSKAVAADGRTFAAFIPEIGPGNGSPFGPNRVVFVNGNVIAGNQAAPQTQYQPTAFQAVTRLDLRGTAGPDVLKTVEGVIVWTVRSTNEEIVAVEGLDNGKTVSAEDGGVVLRATSTPRPDGATFQLTITLGYNPAAVQPAGQENNAMGSPGLPALPVRLDTRMSDGLTLTDAAGTAFPLKFTSTTYFATTANGSGEQVREIKATVIPTSGTKGPPVKLTFHGSRAKSFEVPFALADVRVAAGTGPVEK
ncbi:MAG: hypothetical protein ACRC7O_15230 [Fimbriiglobus sp.]